MRGAALGGLHVIGTERHESRRIDNQLRGRTGRQVFLEVLATVLRPVQNVLWSSLCVHIFKECNLSGGLLRTCSIQFVSIFVFWPYIVVDFWTGYNKI